MHIFGALELDIRPGTANNPAGVKIALLRYTRGEDGRLFVTPECSSLEEIEGQINSLQDELDEIRERARRTFQVAPWQPFALGRWHRTRGVGWQDQGQPGPTTLSRGLDRPPCHELDVAAADAKVRQILVVEAFQLAHRFAEDEPCSNF